MNEIRIDQQFKSWIAPLTQDEFEQLEANILKDGCRDPLVVWNDVNGGWPVLIDGHNRYTICTKHNIPFKTIDIQFESYIEAKNWIVYNQIGRRNITPDQRRYLIGKLYLEEKKERTDTLIQNAPIGNNFPTGSTAERIGEQFGVSDRTVKNNADYAEAVDTIADTYGHDVKDDILSGKTKMPVKEITKRAEQLFTSDTPEWYTPKMIVSRVVEFFGEIDLDPCSNDHGDQANVPAKNHFTKDDNGLTRDWTGRIYMNPPYGREVAEWVSKLKSEVSNGHVEEAVVLIASRTDTQWFNSLVKYGCVWCAVEGRLSFTGPNADKNGAPFPSAIFYIGDRVQDFYHIFKDFGPIYRALVDEEMMLYD
jgi:phage N-6-adenine-methyltransferase